MFLSCVLHQKAPISKLLSIFPGGRSHFSLNFWASLDPKVTVRQISPELCPNGNFLIFWGEFHLQFISGALNYTGASLCAASFNLPRAYNALLGGALVDRAICLTHNCNFHLRMTTWININGFSPNLICVFTGVVGWCESVVYLTPPGRSTDIGLQLGKACYPCSR